MTSTIKTSSELNPTDRAPTRKSIGGTGVTLEGIEIAYNQAYTEYVDFCDMLDEKLENGGSYTDDDHEHTNYLCGKLARLDRAMEALGKVLETL